MGVVPGESGFSLSPVCLSLSLFFPQPLLFCLDHLSPDLSEAQHFFFFLLFLQRTSKPGKQSQDTNCEATAQPPRASGLRAISGESRCGLRGGCGEQYPSGKNKLVPLGPKGCRFLIPKQLVNWEPCGKATGLGIRRVLPWIAPRLRYQSAIWSR